MISGGYGPRYSCSMTKGVLVFVTEKKQECGFGPSGGAVWTLKFNYIGYHKENDQLIKTIRKETKRSRRRSFLNLMRMMKTLHGKSAI